MKAFTDTDENGTGHVVPPLVVLTKASAHVGEQLNSMPIERYAFRILAVLVPKIFVRAYHSTSLLNSFNITSSTTDSGIVMRDRRCVGLSPHCNFNAYGRLLHATAGGVRCIESDVVQLFRVVCRIALENDFELSKEAWGSIRDSCLLDTFHKSLECTVAIPASCISRILVDFTVVSDRTVCPRQLVCYDYEWPSVITNGIGHLSPNDDDSGVTGRLINAIESVVEQSKDSYEDMRRKGVTKAKRSVAAETMIVLWFSGDSTMTLTT